jgi:peptide/nickel transport system permease protein
VIGRTGFARLGDPYRSLFGASQLLPQQVMGYVAVSFLAALLFVQLLKVWIRRSLHRSLPGPLSGLLMLALSVSSWYLFGFDQEAWKILQIASVPVAVYVLLSFGETSLIMRTSMMDTLHEDYVITARAKGLAERVVRDRHAARNAFLPVLSNFVVGLPYILTGMVIIERSVDWPGMGTAIFGALENQDMPVILGALLAIGLLSMLTRLGLDIAYALLDPRIRSMTEPAGRLA